MKKLLLEKFSNKKAKIGVVGLGYVGLPFAVEKAKVGFRVIGIESNSEKVNMINSKKNYISDVKDEDLYTAVNNGLLRAETSFEIVKKLDVVIIAVPTPLTRNLTPDISYIESVTTEISKYIHEGMLICLESTTYPGTTEEIMQPILESTGLKVGDDFYLAHSPERVDPGNARYTTKNTNKVVGGVGADSLEVAIEFYSQTIDTVVPVSSSRAAELVKVYENTYRSVNIALVNELTLLCDRMDLNVWEVLDAAFTKPFGISPFYPGPGVGGHCIPLDPHYLEWKAREYNFNTRFIALSGELNRQMPEFVVCKARRILGKKGVAMVHSKILLLGLAYKKDIADDRESPAVEVFKELLNEDAELSYHDPYINTYAIHGHDYRSIELNENSLNEFDLVIITTDHSNVDYEFVVEHSKIVFDTRYIFKGQYNKDKVILL